VRIISGRFKGKIISAPNRLPSRPTTDFAKTGLFNILANHLDFEAVSVLDLFCGTGNISYEFASRGCEEILAVDEDAHCVKFVNETFRDLKLSQAKAFRSDVFRFIDNCKQSFDVIFADPPFEFDASHIPEIIFEKKLLNEDGWLIIEHQSKQKLETEIPAEQIRIYGNCAFSIYRNK
jgi:16S rRNA (guanine966-N2)-methyltransferase